MQSFSGLGFKGISVLRFKDLTGCGGSGREGIRALGLQVEPRWVASPR